VKKRNIFVSVIALLAITWAVAALVPPPPANQNIGINDTSIANIGSTVCRNAACHGSDDTAIANRHHNLVPTGEWNCQNCHPTLSGGGIILERNCVQCHNGTAWRGATSGVNVSRPHHINTNSAQTRQCKSCHGSYVANFNDSHYVPTYSTSLVTPATHYKIYNSTSQRYWGGCFACHQDNATITPVLLNQSGTHHAAISGISNGIDHQSDKTPGSKCNWCHTVNATGVNAEKPIGYPNNLLFTIRNSYDGTSWQTDPANLTGCEQCHDVGTLHNIQVSYVNNGPLGYGHINNNWDCNGCHAFWDAGSIGGAPVGALVPDVTDVTPSKLAVGVETQVTITGTNFLSGDGTFNAGVSIDGGTSLTGTATDTQIIVTVPALTAGVHTFQVIKTGDPTGDKVSKLSTLVVESPVTITSAKLVSGVITITGTGFGTVSQQYVTIDKAGTVYYSDSITSWSDTEIVAASAIAAVGDTVTVTTPTGSATATIEAGIIPTSITVTSPNGGENWKRGTTHTITWTNVGNPGSNVKIELLKGTSVNRVIASNATNTGSYNWKIKGDQSTGTTYKVRITSKTNPQYTDMSDGTFTISR
jgi:hypothetical protein